MRVNQPDTVEDYQTALHFTCRSLTGILAINIAILILLCFLEQSNSEIKKSKTVSTRINRKSNN